MKQPLGFLLALLPLLSIVSAFGGVDNSEFIAYGDYLPTEKRGSDAQALFGSRAVLLGRRAEEPRKSLSRALLIGKRDVNSPDRIQRDHGVMRIFRMLQS